MGSDDSAYSCKPSDVFEECAQVASGIVSDELVRHHYSKASYRRFPVAFSMTERRRFAQLWFNLSDSYAKEDCLSLPGFECAALASDQIARTTVDAIITDFRYRA